MLSPNSGSGRGLGVDIWLPGTPDVTIDGFLHRLDPSARLSTTIETLATMETQWDTIFPSAWLEQSGSAVMSTTLLGISNPRGKDGRILCQGNQNHRLLQDYFMALAMG